MKEEFKKALKEGLVDFLIGRGVEKLQSVKDKPGLYQIPEFEILGRKINLGENFAFKPKEGNALIINKGNQLETFLLTHKGYCFLYELFPEEYGKVWDQEKNKWWIVQIPNTPERVDKIIEFLSNFSNVNNFLKPEDIKFLKENVSKESFQTDVYAILEDGILEEVYDKTGYLVFQSLTFQKSPGFRKINFSQFDESVIAGSEKLPIRHREELSPYYRASFFPYAFVVPEAEDANNIPTKVAVTVKAQCVNPYIAHVMSGDPFVQFSSTVINAVTEVVRESFVHDISRKIILDKNDATDDQKSKASENIIQKLQTKIATELTGSEKSESTFFGFDFGFTKDATEIVQIIDIDIVGPLAEKMKAQAAENYRKQNERDNQLADSINGLEVAKNNATAEFTVKTAEAKAIKDAAGVLGLTVKQYIETILKPKQKEEQIAAYKPGNITLDSGNLIKDIINK